MENDQLKPYPQEGIILQNLAAIEGRRILCTSPGRAQLAFALAEENREREVYCHYLDIFRANLAEQLPGRPANLSIICSADLPELKFDAVCLPTSFKGEAELTRELIQQGFERLRIGGTLFVSTDNPEDSWLGAEMRKVSNHVRELRGKSGTLYILPKKEEMKRPRDLSSEFAFRDGERLIKAFSRPGVFSHRKVDLGARRLMEIMEVHEKDKVLDLGCGWGTLSLAAALRAPGVQVVAVDSNARAIECTIKSAELNGISNIEARLAMDGGLDHEEGAYDLVLANPPYYADFRIAELFMQTGRRALKEGGRILFVTKLPKWYQENLPKLFRDVEIVPAKDYWIASGRR